MGRDQHQPGGNRPIKWLCEGAWSHRINSVSMGHWTKCLLCQRTPRFTLSGAYTPFRWYLSCFLTAGQKLLRRAIVANQRNQKQLISYDHLFHCLDGLRQDVMCVADDTPMPAAKTHHIGDGQIRLCRDWNKLLAWSMQPKQNACHKFDDYREVTNTLELFAFCPPDSPYYPVMESYFQIHGHKDPYEQKDNGTPRAR